MTKVSYTLEPIGDIQSNVLDPGAFSGDIAATQDGFFIADDGGPGGEQEVFGRLFDLSGHAETSPFIISTNPGSNVGPSSAVLKNGTLVTAYRDLSDADVYVALNSATGTTIKSSFTVPPSSGDQSDPSVASLKDGSYVVTWMDQPSLMSSNTDTIAQHYDLNGNTIGGPIQVEAAPDLGTDDPSVAGLTSGGFVVAFQKVSGLGGNTALSFRIFDSTGTGGTIIDSDTSGTENYSPEVIGLKGGGFAVVYESDGWNAATSGDDITLQIFNADGSPRTNHIRVNSANLLNDDGNTVEDQDQPTLTQLKNGDLVVGWRTEGETSDYDVKARVFDLKGHAITGISTLANSTDDAVGPSVAGLKNGHVAVSFESYSGADDNLVGGELQLVRTSVGTKHADTIHGDELTDRIAGRGGDDTLFGGHGADVLKGGKGADDMHAGNDDDKDIFVFDKGTSSADNPDRIFQFDAHDKHEKVWDRIDLSALDVKWKDIDLHHHDDGHKVRVDVHVDGGPDLVIEVKVDDLSHKDFIL